ncbi:EAL domain-containing protein [Paraburkholderia hospita]|jgi:EAL domain-containing protein (putative c-di-GMP-specific phosphodiesterase class I)|uniref:EAL domain-containing protein n=3 Tax=Burkholderiaceae TaxID=119060 RepID=A0AAJ5B990_9BURK|nr:EAL domain-containing protein [Paraburkholderia hospita]EUC14051.1 diguanylate phosphodiesterase [Burkholderia sp. BT03]AXE98323.1 EAL domain-containing protein [Paraburkholderia hospita]OUL84936.1 EAL domain-containing protein [Paraburkholderia hospita]OUL92004.1 EAL domain-containing protein [Paraburkholderia hospita]
MDARHATAADREDDDARATTRTNNTMHTPRLMNQLEQRVSEGLLAGEFRLAFQGIYDVQTGKLARVEALIRWMHPDYGMLLPDAFLVALDHPLVALQLTYHVIDGACRALAHAQRQGQRVCPIAVNVPPRVVADEHFPATVMQIARLHGVEPDLLELELVETEDATRLLAAPPLTKPLREAGMRLAIDDFGTGYSSLALLSTIDVDTVKVAREMLDGVPDCPRASAVASGVLSMLERLNVAVVVEGVETRALARWLAQWPKVLAQGFFYARPTFEYADVPLQERYVAL